MERIRAARFAASVLLVCAVVAVYRPLAVNSTTVSEAMVGTSEERLARSIAADGHKVVLIHVRSTDSMLDLGIGASRYPRVCRAAHEFRAQSAH